MAERGGQDFLEAVDPQVDGEVGWSSTIVRRLNGVPWYDAYRILRGDYCIPGEDASDLVLRREREELSCADPADVGALD